MTRQGLTKCTLSSLNCVTVFITPCWLKDGFLLRQKRKTLARFFISLACLAGLVNKAPAQQPIYPIIFVHGLGGNDRTFEGTINFMVENFGWDNPYPDDQGVFHAVLNASGESTIFSDDVLTEFGNATNDLYKGKIYAINFENWWNAETGELMLRQDRNDDRFSESNEAAILKQGFALGRMIRRVLEKTNAEKVILVGHSMGGLASREYLQRDDENGSPKWWVTPANEDGHRIAKLVTTGTPHAGSNMTEFGAVIGLNPKSEAGRDLAYNYFFSGPPDPANDTGIYLFGGFETGVPVVETTNQQAQNVFLNSDVNANGKFDDEIIGLNSFQAVRLDNPQIPLPRNVDYTWITSDVLGVNGDGAVRIDRQYLDSVGDTLLIRKNHIQEGGDARSIIRALDEPDVFELAYEIKTETPYHVFSNVPSKSELLDVDWFIFRQDAEVALELSLTNVPQNGQNATVSLSLFYADSLEDAVVSKSNDAGAPNILISTTALAPGNYALRISSDAQMQSWRSPMTLRINPKTAFSPEYLKITESPGKAAQAAIDVTAEQNSHVVWQDDRDGNWEIYFSILSSAGNFLVQDVRVTNTSSNSTRPDISLDAAGNNHVVWREGSEIWFCVLNPAGGKLTKNTKISDGLSKNPSIAVTAEGRSQIVWERQQFSSFYVYHAQVGQDGVKLSPEVRLSDWDIIGGFEKRPRVELNASGQSFVVWRDWYVNLFPRNQALFLARVAPEGNITGQWRLMNQDNTLDPDIAINDKYFYFMHSDERNGERGVYSILDFEQDERIDNGAVNPNTPVVAADATHNAYVAWRDERDGNEEIYLAHLTPEKQTLGDFRVTNTPGVSSNPDIEMDGTGEYFLVWQDNSSGKWEIFISRGPGEFTPVSPPDLIISQIDALLAGEIGAEISVALTVDLLEGQLTNGTYVEVFLYASADSVFSDDDERIGQSTDTQFLNDALNSEKMVTQTITAMLPANAGEYYYLAVVDPTNFHSETNEENNHSTGARFVVDPEESERFILHFPLKEQDPFSAKITSIFDHSFPENKNFYTDNGETRAYTGELGSRDFDESPVILGSKILYGFAQNDALSEFFVNGMYTGGGDARYLFYDGHPGFDYSARSTEIIIYAPADGEVFVPTAGGDPVNGSPATFNSIAIQHDETYSTWYLHSSQHLQTSGPIKTGEPLAHVGSRGASSNHLHFEIRKNGVPVDPYGWQGIGDDPDRLVRGVTNEFLWHNTTKQVEWHFTETFEKWRTRDALNKGINAALGDKWVLEPGKDPGVISPELLWIEAQNFKKIELRMGAKGGGESQARLFFKTAHHQNYSMVRSIVFTGKVIRDGDQRVYTADLSQHPLWDGRIVEIRIDPVENELPPETDATIFIDYIKFIPLVTSVKDERRVLAPNEFRLSHSFPNPFLHATTIRFSTSQNKPVRIAVYNILGQRIRTLLEATVTPGDHAVNWNARDENGARVPPGVYFVALTAPGSRIVRKMIVLSSTGGVNK